MYVTLRQAFRIVLLVFFILRGCQTQSLFSVVTEKMPNARGVNMGSFEVGNGVEVGDTEARERKERDSVKAGDIWGENGMMEMLGIEDDTEDDEETPGYAEMVDEGTVPDGEVPSVLSALYDKMNTPGSNIVPTKCKIPGMKGNVVRMLPNKGNILYEDQVHSMVELRFSFKHSLHEYENITQAEIQISPRQGSADGEGIGAWLAQKGLVDSQRFKYEIYHLTEKVWEVIRRKVPEWKTAKKNGAIEKDLSLLSVLGKPAYTAFYSSYQPNKKTKVSIDIKRLVEKWRKQFFSSRRRVICRALLLVTVERPSVMTKQCIRPLLSKPKLLLVSLDKRQCPSPVASYVTSNDDDLITPEEEKFEVRQKRDAGTQEDGDTEGIMGKIRKTKRKNANTRNATGGAGGPDAVESRSLHSGGSRVVRSTACRRHPMHVSFNDVGWDEWIIAPRGYHAHRCAGDCPFPLTGRLNGTNHAVLLTMMHSMEPWNTPQPCCVPTVLSPISLLYFDTFGNVVLRQYEDMVVTACGCR